MITFKHAIIINVSDECNYVIGKTGNIKEVSYLFKLELLSELERQRGRNLTPISVLLVTEIPRFQTR